MLRLLRQFQTFALALAFVSSLAWSNADSPCDESYLQLALSSPSSGVKTQIISEIRDLHLRREDIVHYAPLTLREIKRQKLRPKLPKIETNLSRDRLLDPREIRFMQSNCNNDYSDGVHTVLENALDLKSGKLTPERLGVIRVWKDRQGRIWTLDHRRLAAIRLAEIPGPIQVSWTDSSTVRSEKNKFTNREDGKSMMLKIGGDWAIKIQ